MRLSPETFRVKPLRRIKTQLLHLVGLISLLSTPPVLTGQIILRDMGPTLALFRELGNKVPIHVAEHGVCDFEAVLFENSSVTLL